MCRPVIIAESRPALKVSFNRTRPRSQPARAGGRLCWLFIFKDTEPSPLQDSFSVRQLVKGLYHSNLPSTLELVCDVPSLLHAHTQVRLGKFK